MSLVFTKEIIRDLVLSYIVIEQFYQSTHVENLLDEIWKLVNMVSYVCQQKGIPCLDTFGIFTMPQFNILDSFHEKKLGED